MRALPVCAVLLLGACGHGSDDEDLGTNDLSATVDLAPVLDQSSPPDLTPLGPPQCSGATASVSTPGYPPEVFTGVVLPAGFKMEKIAAVANARHLAALPNGDLLVGTSGGNVSIVPNAEGSAEAGTPSVFTTINDAPVQGVAFARSTCTLYLASQHGVYSIPYVDGQLTATSPTKIADVRTGTPTPASDGDVHITTSVAFTQGSVFAGVGSGCNACVEVDPTRATVQQMGPAGESMTTRATRIRNAIAMGVVPATGTLFVGGAGQDNLALGHPYEFFDALTLHTGTADYGWPDCEENQHAYVMGADCSATVAPIIELPAYSTIIAAAYYPAIAGGAYVFPSAYRSGFFLTGHGSWHTTSGKYYTPPRVAFVPMNPADPDHPVTPVDWNDPTKQWSEFVGGYQLADGNTRIGRPSGIAIGVQGSLFVADDLTNGIYRIRPL